VRRCQKAFRLTREIANLFRSKTLGADAVDASKEKLVRDARFDRLAHQHRSPVFLVKAFQACGQVNGSSQRRIVHAVIEVKNPAHPAYSHITEQPDSRHPLKLAYPYCRLSERFNFHSIATKGGLRARMCALRREPALAQSSPLLSQGMYLDGARKPELPTQALPRAKSESSERMAFVSKSVTRFDLPCQPNWV
jgi:hypothetical protein